jgi:hypothetical protein
MNGVDLPTIQQILGHREIEMTLRHSHLRQRTRQRQLPDLGKPLTGLRTARQT